MDSNEGYLEMLEKMNGLVSKYGANYSDLDNETKKVKNLISELANDEIVLADKPVDFAPVKKDLYFKEMDLPAWLNEGIQQGYKFFFMRFPLGLKSDLQFNTVNFKMEFQKNEAADERPFFYKFFPNDEVKKIIEGSLSGKVVADANFNFKPIPDNPVGNASAAGEGSFNIKFNFPFSFGKTVITASPQGMNYAEWTFTAKDMKKQLENFAAILKVRDDVKTVNIALNSKGKRNTKNSTWLPPFLAKWIEILHAKGDEQVKTFIKEGLPYTSPAKSWKLILPD